MGKIFTNSPIALFFRPLQKKWFVMTENIYTWLGFNWLGYPLMLRTNYRCVQSSNITVDVAKCGDNFHKLIQYIHYFSVTKIDLSRLNYLFIVRTQLISISSNAKNNLQMCSVNQHQFRRRQMWGKFSLIHPVHSLFIRYKKWLGLNEQSIQGKVSTH